MKKQGRIDFRINKKSKRLLDSMAKALGFMNTSRFVAFAITDKMLEVNDSESKKTRIGVVVSNSGSNRSQLRKIFESKLSQNQNYTKLLHILDEIEKTLQRELLTSATKIKSRLSALDYSKEYAELYAQFQVSAYEESDYTRVKYISNDYQSFEQFKSDFRLERITQGRLDLRIHEYFCRRLLSLSVEKITLLEDDIFLDKINELFISINNTLELYFTNQKINADNTETLNLLKNKTIEVYRICEVKNKERNGNNSSSAEV